MPIHDQGYRRYGGERAPRGQAWAVIAKAGVRTFFAKRAFVGLLLAAWIQFVVRCAQVYFAANFPQARQILDVNSKTFRDFFDIQAMFVFFITVYVGAGLIANDRRANALQIYLSKPPTRTEYILGKLAILMTMLLLVTWVPAILLLVVQVTFSGNFTFFRNNAFLFPAITLFSFVYVVMMSASMLALSSLSNSSRYVGILYTGLIFFTKALYGVLWFVTGTSSLSWVSFSFNLEQVGDAIFRLPPRYDTPWTVSLLMIGLLVLASGLVLERRVRGVEIVA